MSAIALPEAAPAALSEIRQQTILAHHHLCRRGARRYVRDGLERADLEQVASLGLLKAVDRYDARGGTPFAAFAWLMIISELGHYVRDRERSIRPPRRVRALERRYAADWERLAQVLQREPHEADLLHRESRGAEAYELGRLRRLAQPLRLDDPQAHAGACAARNLDPADRLTADSALRAVDGDERQVLVGIYWCGMSLVEIGARIERSPRAVARLHRNALGKIRRTWWVEAAEK